MSAEDHEELSPLHRLTTRLEARLATNELHADRHPDPQIRFNAGIRVEVYRLVLSEMRATLAEVAKDQVDRIVSKRAKEHVIATEAAVKAMKVV